MLDMPLKIKKRIERLEEEIEELSSLKGVSLSPRVQTSGISDPTSAMGAKVADKSIELRELTKAYYIAVAKLSGYFDSLDEQMAEIMRLRFVEGLSTYAIADKIGLDRTTVSKKISKERKRSGL